MSTRALPQPPILLITDRHMAVRPLPDIIGDALKAGCRWILVREKDLGAASLTSLVADVAALARPHGATVSVSGDAACAASAGAQGVHLPHAKAARDAIAGARRGLGPTALIGVSAHNIDEVATAARNGADYVTLSPVFLTVSKPGYGPALGHEGLREAAAQVPLPILALAGVDAANAVDCRNAGAAGLAVMGSVMRAAHPGCVMAAIIAAWRT